MTDALYPECPECGAQDGIVTAGIGPPDKDHIHTVTELQLACGHTYDDPPMTFDTGTVTLLAYDRPETIYFTDVGGGDPRDE